MAPCSTTTPGSTTTQRWPAASRWTGTRPLATVPLATVPLATVPLATVPLATVPVSISAAVPQATPAEAEIVDEIEAIDRPWVTVVWDDPVNLMHYVTYIFQKLFGYSKDKARQLMLQVHSEGKAVVSSGSRDKVENDVRKLHAAGLWATMQRDS